MQESKICPQRRLTNVQKMAQKFEQLAEQQQNHNCNNDCRPPTVTTIRRNWRYKNKDTRKKVDEVSVESESIIDNR